MSNWWISRRDQIAQVLTSLHVPTRALPMVTVPTLAATGSEMNSGAVISNEKTTLKSFVVADCLYPRVALVDPELTVSVPQDQTAFGVCDLIMESFLLTCSLMGKISTLSW